LIYDQSHELRSVFSNTMCEENTPRRIASDRVQAYAGTERGHGASMRPVKLSDRQLAAVFDAVKPLSVASRDAFLRDLAAALQGITDPGDGDVARAIRAVQRKHFDPPETDERQEPHPRRMAKAR
jgi:hypothetical protein